VGRDNVGYNVKLVLAVRVLTLRVKRAGDSASNTLHPFSDLFSTIYSSAIAFAFNTNGSRPVPPTMRMFAGRTWGRPLRFFCTLASVLAGMVIDRDGATHLYPEEGCLRSDEMSLARAEASRNTKNAAWGRNP
jgi:hypothetical protein